MEKKVIKFNLVGTICVFIIAIALIVGVIVGIPKIINKSKDDEKKAIQSTEEAEEIDENKEYIEKIATQSGEEEEHKFKICKSDLGYSMKYDYELFFNEKNVAESDRYISLYSNTVGITVEKRKGQFAILPQFLNKSLEELEKEIQEANNSIADLSQSAIPQTTEEGTPELIEAEEMENGVVTKTIVSSEQVMVEPNQESIQEYLRNVIQEINVNDMTEFSTIQTEVDGAITFKRTIITSDRVDYLYCIRIDEETFYTLHMYCGEDFVESLLPVMEYMISTFEFIEE